MSLIVKGIIIKPEGIKKQPAATFVLPVGLIFNGIKKPVQPVGAIGRAAGISEQTVG